jgi:hypothetical protein
LIPATSRWLGEYWHKIIDTAAQALAEAQRTVQAVLDEYWAEQDRL